MLGDDLERTARKNLADNRRNQPRKSPKSLLAPIPTVSASVSRSCPAKTNAMQLYRLRAETLNGQWKFPIPNRRAELDLPFRVLARNERFRDVRYGSRYRGSKQTARRPPKPVFDLRQPATARPNTGLTRQGSATRRFHAGPVRIGHGRYAAPDNGRERRVEGLMTNCRDVAGYRSKRQGRTMSRDY